MPQEIFRASPPGLVPYPYMIVSTPTSPLPLDKMAETVVTMFRAVATDVTIISDSPSRLRDGTSVREVELKMALNGEPFDTFGVATKKGDIWINVSVGSLGSGKREDLKDIPHSLEFQPGQDERVKVPPDVQEFLDSYCRDLISHDMAKVMTHFSDRFLNSGMKRREVELYWSRTIASIASFEVSVTEFVAANDRVYLTGFVSANNTKYVLGNSSIIKENGEWKFYGNQRDPVP
jgi:hypothetical protein